MKYRVLAYWRFFIKKIKWYTLKQVGYILLFQCFVIADNYNNSIQQVVNILIYNLNIKFVKFFSTWSSYNGAQNPNK